MCNNNIEVIKEEQIGTVLYVAYDNKYYGSVLIVDEIKDDSYEMIKNLKDLNVKTVILTGDNENTAKAVGSKLNIDYVVAKLLPNEKLEELEKIINAKQKNSSVVYVGDGINDTPSLKLADVGVAIEGVGNDEAVEVSDVVLLSKNMNNLVKAIKVSKFTKRILIQNIVFSLLVKFIALVVGTIGILGSFGMLLGVFADVGVCLITILNTLRILKYGGK
jgi:Cd2+/Zn2+-exporting ATPase